MMRNVSHGSDHYCAKLTEAKVAEIVIRLGTGERASRIAVDYGVSYYAVRDIRDGETWKHVKRNCRSIERARKGGMK